LFLAWADAGQEGRNADDATSSHPLYSNVGENVMNMIEKNKALANKNSLVEQVRANGRRHRQRLVTLAAPAAAPRALRNDVLPPLAIVSFRLDQLVAPKRALRKLDPARIMEIVGSISALGFCIPIVVGKDNVIIDGVARFGAAKQMKLDTVPYVTIDHLSGEEQRILRIALNRLAEKGEWDLDALKIEFEELIEAEADMDLTMFAPDERDVIMFENEIWPNEDGPIEPSPGAVAITHRGDLFQLGPHRLICGDSTQQEIIDRLFHGKEIARLVMTDEPYNMPAEYISTVTHSDFVMGGGEMSPAEFLEFNEAWMKSALRHLISGGMFGTFIDWRNLHTVLTSGMKVGLTLTNVISWVKTNPGNGVFYLSQVEYMPLFKYGNGRHVNNIKMGKNGRWRSNVWNYPGGSTFGSDAQQGRIDHPTVQSCLMLKDALLDITNSDDIVLDPFLGSGSMLIACHRAKRRCHGVEMNEKYCDVIIRRYEKETGQEAILQETGETFRELTARRAEQPSANSIG
jgi:DNA modification methylase